jgi:hypothetical protein
VVRRNLFAHHTGVQPGIGPHVSAAAVVRACGKVGPHPLYGIVR